MIALALASIALLFAFTVRGRAVSSAMFFVAGWLIGRAL